MYETEQKELIKTVSAGEKDLETDEQKNVDMRLLLKTLRELTDFKELTPTIVNSLIQRIEVHNNDKSSGHCYIKVDIYSAAVGMIEIPDKKEISEIISKIQKIQKYIRLDRKEIGVVPNYRNYSVKNFLIWLWIF